VTLGDVAKVELGAEKYDYLSRFNGNPASGLGVNWPPGKRNGDRGAGAQSSG
jgi:multidrug efflux pump